MEKGIAYYDGGFYNIGVRPTHEDLGLGTKHPVFGPLSYSRQEQNGRNPDPVKSINPEARVTVDGAFKTPTLRNIELTGPYMHNGGMKSLEEVVQFYTRGADFFTPISMTSIRMSTESLNSRGTPTASPLLSNSCCTLQIQG